MTALVEDRTNPVLIVGAGIAGMAAAMHLAQAGHQVHLLDAAPAIGGSMHLLDHTFPTNSCGICLMLPHQPALCPTLECQAHDHLSLLPYAELLTLEGQPGRFRATIRHKARYVDLDKCSGCGDCAVVCPEPRPHDHEGWLSPVKAIYRPPGLRAVPDGWLIDMQVCTRCGECVQACPHGAIDLDMQDREEVLPAGAVLLTPGFAPFDARLKGEYGYRVYDNVLSALEFERMVSLAGSSLARLHRPSDGQKPKHMAFVHCVGSRDKLCGAGHCSSACCMFTAKQVALAKQLDPELQITVFTMDLRAFGKDFEAYLDAVQALPGVTYRRAMPSSVHQLQQSRDLLLTYAAEDGRLQEAQFDLLVLATGFAPPQGMQHLARELGLALNDFGFALTDGYHPTRTAREGVFVAGAFREPKDIPDTVAEAAGAAAEVAAFLRAGRRNGGRPTAGNGRLSNGQARDIVDEEPRVGVFVCQCQGQLSPLGLPEVVAWAETLPGVALARAVPEGCSAQGRDLIQAAIEAEGLNRVVVAGCTHRLYADEFDDLMRAAGLDPRLLARVNLREQVALPHRDHDPALGDPGPVLRDPGPVLGDPGPVLGDPGPVLRDRGPVLRDKARSLVGMAVAGLRSMAGLEALALGAHQPLHRRALVIGGGAAGMTAALHLAALDIPVHLVERTDRLGGQWRHLRYQADGSDPETALRSLIARLEAEARIQVHREAEVTELAGTLGNYSSLITANGTAERVDHGVLVVATGGKPAATAEYLYGQDPRVLTQRELEHQMAEGTLATVQSVVMIQCVGSREPERPYCSRICCTQAVKNALKLKELRPEVDVYVLYREMRTYGFREAYYEAARDAGVVFLRYELPEKPAVQAGEDALQVSLAELVTGQPLALQADLLVLSVGLEGEEESRLAQTLGLALNDDGFFQEEHAKMKPLDAALAAGLPAAKGGVYLAGLAHSPRFLDETLAQAQGAAMRAAAFLAPETVTDRPTSVWVNERLCSFCGLCVEACPYGARLMNEDTRLADVDYALCQGCGVCAMVCPNKATLQKTLEHKQLLSAIDMALI